MDAGSSMHAEEMDGLNVQMLVNGCRVKHAC